MLKHKHISSVYNKVKSSNYHPPTTQIPMVSLNSLSVCRDSIATRSKLSTNRDSKGGISEALAWDDLTGMKLNGHKVLEARSKEIAYVRDKRVWKKISRRTYLPNIAPFKVACGIQPGNPQQASRHPEIAKFV